MKKASRNSALSAERGSKLSKQTQKTPAVKKRTDARTFAALFGAGAVHILLLPLFVPVWIVVFLWSVPFRLHALYLMAKNPFLAGDAVGRFLMENDRSVTFWDLYCAFRHGRLSRRDSLFNAFYLRLSERAHRGGKLQKSVLSVPEHPSGWYKHEEQARRRTFSRAALSVISRLPAILSFVPGRIKRFFKHAARSMESSHTAVGTTGRFFKRRAGLLIPLAVTAVVCFVMIYFANIPLTYAVRVNGETIGYVESRGELQDALREVESGVSDALGCSFKFPENISYSLDKVVSPRYLSKTELTKKLNTYTQDFVKVGYALYVDSKLCVASENEAVLRNLLNSALETAKTAMGSEDLIILNTTRITYQNCPTGAFLSERELSDIILPVAEGAKSGLSAITLNAYAADAEPEMLPLSSGGEAYSYSLTYGDAQEQSADAVKLIFGGSRIEEVKESVPFNITYRESDSVYLGAQYVYQKGAEGQKLISYQVFYSGETEYSRAVVSESVLKEPIDQIVLIGTKELPQGGEVGDGTPISTAQHCFIPPVYGSISSYFGMRDLNGDGIVESGHKGVDIPAPYGTPIYASMSGTVIEAGSTGTSYGNAVKILHPNGLYTYYAHLAAVTVQPGQVVSQNQMIGSVGTSGYVTGPHVHYEVHLSDGTRTNPLLYLIGY